MYYWCRAAVAFAASSGGGFYSVFGEALGGFAIEVAGSGSLGVDEGEKYWKFVHPGG